MFLMCYLGFPLIVSATFGSNKLKKWNLEIKMYVTAYYAI